jgi:hypothetical protein
MWYYNLTVNYVFAHAISQNAQVYFDGLGWRVIRTGDSSGITRVFQLCSDAANSGRKVHAYIDANGQISSAQLA